MENEKQKQIAEEYLVQLDLNEYNYIEISEFISNYSKIEELKKLNNYYALGANNKDDVRTYLRKVLEIIIRFL